MPRAGFRWCAVLVLGVGCAGEPRAASAAISAPATIAPHAARYDLSLASIRPGDTIDAAGEMAFSIADECDAWSTSQHLHMRTVSREGDALDTVSDYATLESKDGRHLTFVNVQHAAGGDQSRVAGTADRMKDGRVLVRFTAPSVKQMTLPRGTLFPLAHTLAIVTAARAGAKALSPFLFDGTSADGAFYTYVTIQGWVPGVTDRLDKRSATHGAALAHIAFYARDDRVGMLPDFELASRFFDDGVTDHLKMDFGDFVLDGRMTKLVPKRRCRSGSATP